MQHKIQAALCLVFMPDGNIVTHLAPHLARVAEVFQQEHFSELADYAVIYELEVRAEAIRTGEHAWFYDPARHVWVRFKRTPDDEEVTYHFERNDEQTSTDWYTVTKVGEAV